jgi:hypothetical protein
MRWDGSVGISAGYGVNDQGSISGQSKAFFSSPQHPDWVCGPHNNLNMDTGFSSPGIKQPRREADHSHPSSAGIKSSGGIPQTFS